MAAAGGLGVGGMRRALRGVAPSQWDGAKRAWVASAEPFLCQQAARRAGGPAAEVGSVRDDVLAGAAATLQLLAAAAARGGAAAAVGGSGAVGGGADAAASDAATAAADAVDAPTSVREVFAASPRLVAICEEVRDPGNLGTIIRAADAAGADAVVLTGRTVDPYNPKVVRATTGSLFHVPVAVGADLAATVERAHGAGMRVIAADVGGEDFLASRELLAEPVAWLFGNEARGLDEASLALADLALRLPIYGAAESLNLATAASVCLYESAFAQRAGA